MDNIKGWITGGIITLVVGGTAFTVSQDALVDNFAKDTGLTQQEAEQYVNNIPENELVSFEELGADYKKAGEETLNYSNSIDCTNYEYAWESPTLSCATGKSQLLKTGNAEIAVGNGFVSLTSEDASEVEMKKVVSNLDLLNSYYSLEISTKIYGEAAMDEYRKTNSYNKSLLVAALESN